MVGKGKRRVYVHRNVRGALQGSLEVRRYYIIFFHPSLSALTIAGRFDCQQLFGEVSEASAYARVVDDVLAVFPLNAALLEQIIKFHHLGAAVRFARTETDGTKDTGEVGVIVFPLAV